MSSIVKVHEQLLSQMQQMQSAAMQRPVRPAMVIGEQPMGAVAVFSQAIKAVDAEQHLSSAKVAAVELGQSDDLVGAMVQSQKASVSFSALLQVRNKLTTAFDDIMRTPL